MKIIPAIDILGGACVRLTRGDYATVKVYESDPVAVAKRFVADGADLLHLVDLDGAKAGRPLNTDVILAIRDAVSVPLQVGGGIRAPEAAAKYLNAGIDRIIIGTKALENINFIKNLLKQFDSDRIVVALDLRNGKVATGGWLQTSDTDYLDFARELKAIGITEVICTDISRDGMLAGPNLGPMERLQSLGLNVSASGGVSSLKSLKKLSDLDCFGAIVGTAIYQGKIDLKAAFTALRPPSGLTKRVIPCMDIRGGRVVKGVGFKNLRDAGDPVALARQYSDQGADELIFLDISATAEKRKTLIALVARVARELTIPFCIGGGIQTLDDIKALLDAGADKVSIGTAAVINPTLITQAAERFGSQCIVISLDAKRSPEGATLTSRLRGISRLQSWRLTARGGRDRTDIDALSFAREMERRGAGELLVNSLDRDGTRRGYDLNLLRAVTSRVRLPVIASSGAGNKIDFLKAFEIGKCDAALAAGLFHDGELTIPELKRFLNENGISVRL